MLSWRVIYPGGDKTRLAIAEVHDYQESDWAIASRKEFEDHYSCEDYMVELGKKHGLAYNASRRHQDYLD